MSQPNQIERFLQGRRALVCGSSQGIGRACAIELARRGAELVLLARDEDALHVVRDELDHSAGQAHRLLKADFDDPDTVRDRAARHLELTGPVHILINNTGGPPSGPILEATADDFLRALRMHLLCGQHLVQVVVPGMTEAGFGRIINIISSSVRTPIRGLGVSNTTRAAMANWARTLAQELAPRGITVNNILPRYIDTSRLRSLRAALAMQRGRTEEEIERSWVEAIPTGRLGRPEEVAAAVAFLASPAAGYITGIDLTVDGGRLATQ
jgi:3-oxoacyl-[acyl-carrier protein] reductase